MSETGQGRSKAAKEWQEEQLPPPRQRLTNVLPNGEGNFKFIGVKIKN